MSPEDLATAYLRWLPHTPEISAEEETLLGRRIAFGLIRMRWAISRCDVVAEIARLDLSFSGKTARVSRLIRRTVFAERQWEEFADRIKLEAERDPSLERALQHIRRGRHEAETAAQTLVRANLRPAAAGYAAKYSDRPLETAD